MIWRRLLVRSDSTIADLHTTLQLVMGWSDKHLHRSVLHGKDYGSSQIGGIGFSDDPHQVQLADFGFRRLCCRGVGTTGEGALIWGGGRREAAPGGARSPA